MSGSVDTLLIETYGNAKYMQSFLDGIVIMMDTGNTGANAPSLFMTVTYVAMVFTISIGLLKIQRTDWWNYFLRLAIPCLLFVVLIKAEVGTIILDDQYDDGLYGGAGTYSVNHVPVGIALPLYVSSLIEKGGLQISDYLNVFTGGITTAGGSTITVAGSSFDIRTVDFFGPARAFATIIDPQSVSISADYNLTRTISEYFQNCVLHGLSMNVIDTGDIVNSPDILTELATPYLAFFTPVFLQDGTMQTQTCMAAYSNIESRLVTASADPENRALQRAGAETMVNAMKAESMINGLMDLVYVGGGGISQSSQLVKNNIMIHSLQGALQENTPEAVSALSIGEAQSSQGMKSAALLFIKKLPLIRSVIQMMIICLFPLIAWSFVTNLGTPFLAWCSGLLWVSLFMPLEGIIHTIYMGTLVDELSAIISTQGLNWGNRQLVLNTLSQSAVVAAGLYMMILALAGMVTTWIMPKAGSSISAMLAGANRIGMQIGSYGTNAAADMYSGKTGMAMQQENMNQMLSGMNPTFNTLANTTLKDHFGARSNPVNGIYGDGSIEARSFGKGANQAAGSQMLTKSEQVASTRQAANTQSVVNSLSDSALKQASKIYQASTGRSFEDTQSFMSGLSHQTQNAVKSSEAVNSNYNLVRGTESGKNMSETDARMVATHLALGGTVGKGLTIGGKGDLGASQNSQTGTSFSESEAGRLNHGAQKGYEVSGTSSDGSTTGFNTGQSSKESASIQQQTATLESTAQQHAKLVSEQNTASRLASIANANGEARSIDQNQVLTMTPTSVLRDMASSNPEKYQALNQAMQDNSSPQGMAQAAAIDFKNADAGQRSEMIQDMLSRVSPSQMSGNEYQAYKSQMEDIGAHNAQESFNSLAQEVQGAISQEQASFDSLGHNGDYIAGKDEALRAGHAANPAGSIIEGGGGTLAGQGAGMAPVQDTSGRNSGMVDGPMAQRLQEGLNNQVPINPNKNQTPQNGNLRAATNLLDEGNTNAAGVAGTTATSFEKGTVIQDAVDYWSKVIK